MASMLTEEQFRCIICQDIFHNPVSIPCGHNYCLRCIKHYWKTSNKTDCPLCREVFPRCPDLRVNVGFKDITEQFKRSLKKKAENKPVAAKRTLAPKKAFSIDDILCDMCCEDKAPAEKTCHVCRISYCSAHLTPHHTDPVLKGHRLTDAAAYAAAHLCRSHNQQLTMFCRRDQMAVCVKCTEKDHKHHDVVTVDVESGKIKTQIKKNQAEVKHLIKARMKNAEEIRSSMQMTKLNKKQELEMSVAVHKAVIDELERNQALLIDEIEQKHEDGEKRGEELLLEINHELNELQSRSNELQELDNTEDALHRVQGFSSLRTLPPSRDWAEVKLLPNPYIGTIRGSMTKLVRICQNLEKELTAEEISKTSQYAVDVTLDPVTAAAWLVLSPDGKKVADKTDWDLGVARESINRKGAITVRPDMGYWAICRRKGSSLSACAGPSVTLQLQEIPQKVGVFLDYDEGLVSFYDTDAKTHIYTYTGCHFTEPVYPYLNPCLLNNGRNTAPLVICAVSA
ncbi:nuclear factor 7, brain-like isoform X2 [Gouania willdenowi]|uniref:E3 ubiquitin-protein ligase TRIM21-like n=1 Tax=Gouania willdenowi TaxID=441366 RepID=A0A8C5G263_GOUWI|nr:nuclear factor 7, brain-like isoform X2 [Gouania willdenowi]